MLCCYAVGSIPLSTASLLHRLADSVDRRCLFVDGKTYLKMGQTMGQKMFNFFMQSSFYLPYLGVPIGSKLSGFAPPSLVQIAAELAIIAVVVVGAACTALWPVTLGAVESVMVLSGSGPGQLVAVWTGHLILVLISHSLFTHLYYECVHHKFTTSLII